MRVNVYAEELPEEGAIEIIGKEIEGRTFTGLRIPLYLPVTLPDGTQARGKFMHHADDDDSSAITIWGKRDLRGLLREALRKLDAYYAEGGPGNPGREVPPHRSGGQRGRDCPHAGPFRYCPDCVKDPCPIGMGGG